jgi:hypothetical protein
MATGRGSEIIDGMKTRPRRRPMAARRCALMLAIVLAGCGGTAPPSDDGAGSTPTSGTSAGADPTATPRQSGPTSGPGATAGALPEPTLTDPAAIGAALWDPASVDVGVVSLLDQLGVPIYDDAGGLVRPATHAGPPGLWLQDREVRGLIEMGKADAAAIAAHQAPFVLGDLSAALAPLVPPLDEQAVLDAYIAAYRAAPGDLVRESLAGHPFLHDTPFTRVHLWLLLVDGVLGRGGATASLRSVTLASWSDTAAAPVASVGLPMIPSPIPGLSAEDFALLMAHVPLLASELQVDLRIAPPIAHEGHGQPGPVVTIEATNRTVPLPLVSPLSEMLLLTPSGVGLDGVPVTFDAAQPGTLDDHGILTGLLGVPILTDASGVAGLSYQVDQEAAAGQGALDSADVEIRANIDLQAAMLRRYVLPPALLPFIWGSISLQGVLSLEWHEPALSADFKITLSGSRDGAGQYVGTADIYCVETPIGGGFGWTATAIPQNNDVTHFSLSHDPSGHDTVSVETRFQTEFSPWFARSGDVGMTATVTAVRSGAQAQLHGTGSWTDAAGHVFSIEIQLTCSPLD